MATAFAIGASGPPQKRQRREQDGPLLNDGERYIGTVKSFSVHKGWGFIASDQMKEAYGKDIMVLQSELPEEFAGVGCEVSFQLGQGRTGLIAKNVQFDGETCLASSKAPSSWKSDFDTSADDGPAANGGDRHVGTIKSFNPVKGWGFVASPEIQATYGKDIMVLKHDLPEGFTEPGSGCQVTFHVAQGRTGLIAKDVVMSGYQAVSYGFQGQAASYGSGHGSGAGRHTGTIKSFNDTKGWGFITSPEIQSMFGKDIMVRKEELPNGFVEAGQCVSFSVKEGRTGVLATNIKLSNPYINRVQLSNPYASNRHQGVGRSGAQRYRGMIKSFNATKGWGFVTSPEIMQLYGKDIMVRSSEDPHEQMAPGVEVLFCVEQGRTGPLATKLQFVGGRGKGR